MLAFLKKIAGLVKTHPKAWASRPRPEGGSIVLDFISGNYIFTRNLELMPTVDIGYLPGQNYLTQEDHTHQGGRDGILRA